MLSISQVAERSGLRVSAIRYYEQEGLLHSAGRRSGKRLFETSVLERLAAIELAKAAGFTLTEIRSVFSTADTGKRPPWRRVATEKNRELERQIRRLEHRREILARLASCTCPTVDDCGRAFMANGGREVAPRCRDSSLGSDLTAKAGNTTDTANSTGSRPC